MSSPSPARAAVATLWPGRPEAPAAAESRFCAAAPAPVSLTLDLLLIYPTRREIRQWPREKNNLSCRARRKESPAWAPLPSHHPARPREGLTSPPKTAAWRAASPPRPGTPTRPEAAGSPWGSLRGFSQGKSLTFRASWFSSPPPRPAIIPPHPPSPPTHT